MRAPSIRAAHAGLEEAGARLRALSLDERIGRLEDVLDALSTPDSTFRRTLDERLPAATGFAAPTLREGLDQALSRWRPGAVRELVQGELGDPAVIRDAPRSTAVVAAGAIPMPTLEAMIAPLVLGSTVLIRPGHRDRVTAPSFRDALAELDRGLGASVAICETERGDEEALVALLEADAVVASGSDASVAAIRERSRPGSRFVGYGHRLSVAVVGPGPTPEAARALALDVSLWDQLGCLSPVAVFALGDAEAWARALADALEETAARLPRGELSLGPAAATQHERAEAELRLAADGRIALHTGKDWTVVCEADDEWRGSPLHRFVRVHPVEDPAALARALEPVRGILSTVGFGPGLEAMAPGLAPRSAPLGLMQTPPLHWNHDGIGTLRPLLGVPRPEAPPGG